MQQLLVNAMLMQHGRPSGMLKQPCVGAMLKMLRNGGLKPRCRLCLCTRQDMSSSAAAEVCKAADLHVGGPEGEVIAQQLHDEGAVLVRLLAQRVQLRDRLVKGLSSRAVIVIIRLESTLPAGHCRLQVHP